MAVNDPISRIEQLLAGAEPAIRDSFLLMVRQIRDSLTLSELTILLEEGRVEEAFSIIDRAVGRFSVVWSQQFVVAAASTADFLNNKIRDIIVGFDQTNTRAVRIMEENQLRLVREFTRIQRDTTRSVLAEGIRRGLNPREQARNFVDSIGLTPFQEGIVRNYRRALENLDRNVLQRELRDRRFDRSVVGAMESGKPLSPERIDRMVDRYRERLTRFRAETIARTEALRSVHEGSEEMYEQAIASGQLDPSRLIQIWNTALDEKVRGSHRPMHLQEQPIGSPFVSGKGNLLRYPGDPEAPAEEAIQCRCVKTTRILLPGEVQEGVSVTLLELE